MPFPVVTVCLKRKGLAPAAGGGRAPAQGGGRGLPGVDAGRSSLNGVSSSCLGGL